MNWVRWCVSSIGEYQIKIAQWINQFESKFEVITSENRTKIKEFIKLIITTEFSGEFPLYFSIRHFATQLMDITNKSTQQTNVNDTLCEMNDEERLTG